MKSFSQFAGMPLIIAQEGQEAEIFGFSGGSWHNSHRGVEDFLVDKFLGRHEFLPLVIYLQKNHLQKTVDHQMYQEKSHEVLTNTMQSLFPVVTMLGVSDDAEQSSQSSEKHPTTQKEGQV